MTKLKRLLITLSVMALMLTFTVLPQANAYDGNGAEADYSSATGTWTDGVSYVRTGFLIYLSDSIGTYYYNADPVFITTYTNTAYLPDLSWNTYSNATLMTTFIGGVAYDPRGNMITNSYSRYYAGIDWNMPPFNSDGSGNGTAIKNWLLSPQNGYDAGVIYMIDTYWGEEIRNIFLERAVSPNPLYFHVEAVAWHGAYRFDEYLGYQWLGTCRSLARHAFIGMYSEGQEPESFGGGYPFKRYDWGNIPKSMLWEDSWCNKVAPSPSDYQGKTTIPWGQADAKAYGIISIRPSDIGAGKQIIQSFYDETGTLIETTSGSSSTTVDMTEEGFTVTNWIVTEEALETPDSTDEYSSIISGVPPTRTGTEDETIELTEDESTVVIKYVQDNTPYRVVKVYEKNGTHKKTLTTGYSNTSYTVQTSSTYQGDSYSCESWFTSKRLPTPSPSSTKAWNSILSSYNTSDTVTTNWDGTSGTVTFGDTIGAEKVIYIYYTVSEGDNTPVISSNVLKPWELNYIFPDLSGQRLGKASGNAVLLNNVLLKDATGTYNNNFSMVDVSGSVYTVGASDICDSKWVSPLKTNFSFNTNATGGTIIPLQSRYSSKYSGSMWGVLTPLVDNSGYTMFSGYHNGTDTESTTTPTQYIASNSYEVMRSAWFSPTIVNYRTTDASIASSLKLNSGAKPASTWVETTTLDSEHVHSTTKSTTVKYRLFASEQHKVTTTEACSCGLQGYWDGSSFVHATGCDKYERKDCNCVNSSGHLAKCAYNSGRPCDGTCGRNTSHSAGCPRAGLIGDINGGVSCSGCTTFHDSHGANCTRQDHGDCNCKKDDGSWDNDKHSDTCDYNYFKDCSKNATCSLDNYLVGGVYTHTQGASPAYTGRCKVYHHFTDTSWSASQTIYSDEGSHSMTHSVEVYTPKDMSTTTTSLNRVANNTYISVGANNSSLKIYPEVEMKYFVLGSGGDIQSATAYNPNTVEKTAYVFGQKQRVWTPNVVHSYAIANSNAVGMTSLPSAVTSSDAKALIENVMSSTLKFSGVDASANISGVCAGGSTFNIGVQTNPQLGLVTFGLTANSRGIGQDATNEAVKTTLQTEHNAYISAMIQDLAPELALLYATPNSNYQYLNGANPADGSAYLLSVTASGNAASNWGIQVGTTQEASIDIEFKDGIIVNKNQIIQKLAELYGDTHTAEEVFACSGIDTQIKAMFVSSTDSENNSTNKWYDEETTALSITFYKTTLEMGDCMASDKVDYNVLSSASGITGFKDGNSAVCAVFYSGLKSRNGGITFGTHTIQPVSPLGYYIEPVFVKDAHFLVMNKTTSDARN